MKRAKKIAVILSLAVSMVCTAVLGGCGAGKQKTSDTVRWFNATYAILTECNGLDYNKFGGRIPNAEDKESVRQLLADHWGVTDRETADMRLEWIMVEGERAGFVKTVNHLTEYGLSELDEEEYVPFFMLAFGLEEERAEFFANTYIMYQEYGGHAIDGWDYCRAFNLLGWYYIADYYTLEEALDKSLEIAKQVQPMYDSWDELIESYLRGYEYWSEGSSDERRAIYEDLKTREDNPYAVDYHITLEKTW
ncbi:MAG: DUF1266 domain-containing protein [Lachnospiraceae bacterium]|nr:DUF1266 domain-containing protein [Lachnospiraceae bacterium]